jgi:hypothetical protein
MSKFVMKHWKNGIIYIFMDPIVQNTRKQLLGIKTIKNARKLLPWEYLPTKQPCFPKNKQNL